MSRYTDWSSGEPIEKEWAMTEPPTELTTEAILDAWVRTGRVPEGGWTVPRLVAAIQAEARVAALAAAEAAPLDEVAERIRALPTHEAGGYEFEWYCVPVSEGSTFSESCGDHDAHYRLVDRDAVLAILEPKP